MIFVGEQTSYTHAWIASALESGIRGGVQLLLGEPATYGDRQLHYDMVLLMSICDLELGLVDEAKATVEKWMARWIEIVSSRPCPSSYV